MATTSAATHQFATAKAFASFMTRERWGRKHIAYLNSVDGTIRLHQLVEDCERWSRWSLEDGGIERNYNAAAYGLGWVVSTGRLNGATELAIKAMTVRQLCELVHTLMVTCRDQGEYAAYLMTHIGGKE